MSHRLGSVINLGAPIVVGPATGPANGGLNVWVATFPVDPAAKFVMLHIQGASLNPADRIEIERGPGQETDVYSASWGPDYWARPIPGNIAVTIRYVRSSGSATASVTIDKYGRGEALIGDGSAQANGDVFLLSSPFINPTHQYSGGKFPSGSYPSWQNVDCLGPGIQRDTARSVGMYIVVDGDHLSSCTATLIGPDLIVTAGHCLAIDEEARTGSVTFDFESKCDNTRKAPYSPQFHKLKRIIRQGYQRAAGDMRPPLDYCVVQIVTPGGGLGVPPVAIRPDVPPLEEPLFIIHHPRGATKKISSFPSDASCKVMPGTDENRVYFNCDIDNGSSGSSIFDSSGRIVANLSWWDWGISIKAAFADIAIDPPPAKDVDVVLVLDRSGSMSQPTFGSSLTKIEDARHAAALFVSLLRTTASHRAGMVTFSTTATPDFAPLAPVNNATKNTLVGPIPPATGGLLGGITANGATTIGGGLQTALGLFPAPTPTTNSRAILLLTDGLENTGPMIATVEPDLGGTLLNVIGFGTEASLDGPGLTRLARDHGGIYTRSHDGLSLEKFFVLSFGTIFNLPTNLDPEFFLPANENATPVPFAVCGETSITAVIGWENANASLLLALRTPGGTLITSATAGVRSASGSTWAHMSISLPFAGERDGMWRVEVTRPRGGGEFPPPAPATRFFVTTLVEGGPYMRPMPMPPLYTGDIVNPGVILREPSGHHFEADVTLEIEAPGEGTGNILTKTGLGASVTIGGDVIDTRAAKLIALEKVKGSPLIPTSKHTVTLFDDGAHEDEAIEPDGVFANPIAELARHEGTYGFHARASYGHDCMATRETSWSVNVSVGIDPSNTPVKSDPLGSTPDGNERISVTFTPRDKYGNYVGPGRDGSFTVDPRPGSKPEGSLVDNGDGSYTQVIVWDSTLSEPPGVSVRQPGRALVSIDAALPTRFTYVVKFLIGEQPECPCQCSAVRPGRYATEINILNPNEKEVRVLKVAAPVVLAGAVIGREPNTVRVRTLESITLPPHSATMDDARRLGDILFGAVPSSPQALSIGFLEIISFAQLDVTAVYTVSSGSGFVDMDVEQIRPKIAPRAQTS